MISPPLSEDGGEIPPPSFSVPWAYAPVCSFKAGYLTHEVDDGVIETIVP